ncbi:TetR/AcrR family transcriptional regulator [Clostridiaceae bacterium HSG29]|nr:TetR/AcrR family transcriptional regulator [Clostridiaceae bacterium HSG29]
MPKNTFFNIKEEKRKMIEEESINEFSIYSYENSSINRIVENCKISKGSFYQYFENKEDLYRYIISLSVEKKMKYVNAALISEIDNGFIKIIKEIFKSGLKFAYENEKLASIGVLLMKNNNSEIYRKVIGQNKNMAIDFYKKLIEIEIENGEIKPDINVEFTSYLINSMMINLSEYFFEINKNNEKKFSEEMLFLVDDLMDMLINGIGS